MLKVIISRVVKVILFYQLYIEMKIILNMNNMTNQIHIRTNLADNNLLLQIFSLGPVLLRIALVWLMASCPV